MKYYEPKWFSPQELVPPEVFAALGDQSLLVMDYRILKTADTIREFFGTPFKINNWSFGGNLKYRGFRPQKCGIGALWSQHRFGRGIDGDVVDVPPDEARKAILAAEKHFPYITAMEDGVNWLHVDCRALADQGIQVFRP